MGRRSSLVCLFVVFANSEVLRSFYINLCYINLYVNAIYIAYESGSITTVKSTKFNLKKICISFKFPLMFDFQTRSNFGNYDSWILYIRDIQIYIATNWILSKRALILNKYPQWLHASHYLYIVYLYIIRKCIILLVYIILCKNILAVSNIPPSIYDISRGRSHLYNLNGRYNYFLQYSIN